MSAGAQESPGEADETLAREGLDTPQKFGSDSYSREELIAEMGSAMLCGVASIEQSTLANSAAYLKTWIARLKSDSKLVISAARAAQKAADYMRGESAKDSPGQRGTLRRPEWRSTRESQRPTTARTRACKRGSYGSSTMGLRLDAGSVARKPSKFVRNWGSILNRVFVAGNCPAGSSEYHPPCPTTSYTQ